MEELRKQLDDEKEAACTRERDNAHKRFEKQVEQEENAYQQQRRRLYAEVWATVAKLLISLCILRVTAFVWLFC